MEIRVSGSPWRVDSIGHWYSMGCNQIEIRVKSYPWRVDSHRNFTRLTLNKMAIISLTIFSNAFSWMKNSVLRPKFHWSFFLRAQLTITSFGLGNGLALNRRQAIIWTNADWIHRRIYVALGGDELILGPLLFKIFYHDILFFLKMQTKYNRADDNSCIVSGHEVDSIIYSLKSET